MCRAWHLSGSQIITDSFLQQTRSPAACVVSLEGKFVTPTPLLSFTDSLVSCCVYVFLYVCVCVWAHVCVCVCVCVCLCVCVCALFCVFGLMGGLTMLCEVVGRLSYSCPFAVLCQSSSLSLSHVPSSSHVRLFAFIGHDLPPLSQDAGDPSVTQLEWM